jgi:6-phosphogluconolactonase (cycloisomerase 2 family)
MPIPKTIRPWCIPAALVLTASLSAGCEADEPVNRKDYLTVVSQDGDTGDAEIRSYKVGSTGNLSQVSSLPVDDAVFITSMDAHPTSPYFYVGDEDAERVYSYSLAKNGAVKETPGSPVDLDGTDGTHVAIVNEGGYLAVAGASDASERLHTFLIDPSDGDLMTLGNSLNVGDNAAGLVGHPGESYIYVVDRTNNTVEAVRLQDDADLSSLGTQTVASGAQPGAAAIMPDGSLVFVVDPANEQMAVFPIDSDGGLEDRSDLAAVGSNPARIAVHPDGTYLYVSNFNDGTVSGFAINASAGTLSELTGSPFILVDAPAGIAISSNGNYLLLASYSDSTVTAFELDQETGLLTEVEGSSANTGENPLLARIVRR